jgi:protein SCO1/2
MLRFSAPFLALVLTAAPPAAPPPGLGEAGLEEKLGQAIPLDLTLRDEAGQPVQLRSLIRKPTLLTLNYFRCAGICTPQLAGVADLLNRTQAVPGRDFQVLTVSFDERDTPAIAAQKRVNYLHLVNRPVPADAWRFLTGDAAASKALADAVGFSYRRQGQDFIHPAVLTFLSPEGVVTRYMYGLAYLPADVQMAVREAAEGQARPTVAKWMQFCFSYDPAGRRYVFSLTRVAATLLLLAAVGFVAVLLGRGPKSGEVP